MVQDEKKEYPITVEYKNDQGKVLKITNTEVGCYVLHGDVIEGTFIFEDGKKLTLKQYE